MDYSEYTNKWEKIFFGKSFCDGYGGIYRDKKWIDNIIYPIVENLNHNPNCPVFVADIGCGSGILGLSILHYINNKNVFLHFIDVNKNQLDGIANEAKRFGIYRNFQAVNSNLFSIAYPDNFFQGIVGRLFLHHLKYNDNERFWKFVVSKLKPKGVICVYSIVAPNKLIADFIHQIYRWRAEKVGVEPQGFIPTTKYIDKKISAIEGIEYKILYDIRGPIFVSGKASIQEKIGTGKKEMAELEEMFHSAPTDVKEICKIRKVPMGRTITHEFFWPCQHITIRKGERKEYNYGKNPTS